MAREKNTLLCQIYAGFQTSSIFLHLLLALWLFVYRYKVYKTMKYLCAVVHPSAAIIQIPFHSYTEVIFKPEMALPVI